MKTMKSALATLYNKAAKNVSHNSMLKTDLLHNKTMLYVVLIVSLINLWVLVIGSDIVNIIIFMLVGFLTAFFSKNMIVILMFALVISNLIKYGIQIGQEGFSEGSYEGMDEGMDDDTGDGSRKGMDGGIGEGMDDDTGDGSRKGMDGGIGEGMDDDIGDGSRKGMDGGIGEGMDDDTGDGSRKGMGEGMGEGMGDGMGDGMGEGMGYEDGGNVKDKTVGKDGFQNGNVITGNTKTASVEGMQTLGFSFVAPVEINLSVSNIINQQKKLLSNLSTMNPYIINVDNESKLRSQIKYSEYTKH